MPIPLVKIFAKQVLTGLDYLHSDCSIIHTDLKPENILLMTQPDFSMYETPKTKEEIMAVFGTAFRLKVIDLGNACWTHKHFTDDVQTRQYRAPEVILGYAYTQAIDIWSMACIIFELLTGDLLFRPHSGKYYEKNDGKGREKRDHWHVDHLAQITELLGKIPRPFALGGKHSDKYYNRRGELRQIASDELKFWPLKEVLAQKYKFEPEEAEQIANFLDPMLIVNPKLRANAKSCLRHEWMRSVDITDLNSVFPS